MGFYSLAQHSGGELVIPIFPRGYCLPETSDMPVVGDGISLRLLFFVPIVHVYQVPSSSYCSTYTCPFSSLYMNTARWELTLCHPGAQAGGVIDRALPPTKTFCMDVLCVSVFSVVTRQFSLCFVVYHHVFL